MVALIRKKMADISKETRLTLGSILALFPVIIGSWTWVSVQLATIETNISHYEQRLSYIEARIEKIEKKVDENENMILRISK